MTYNMRLSQKKTCAGCKSAGPSYSPCELGFKVERVYPEWKGNIPLEPCYKPKTNDEWLRARKIVEEERNPL